MFAKIKTDNNKVIYSTIFAIRTNGFSSNVIIFNTNTNSFESVNMYNNTPLTGLQRVVFILDTDNSEFITLKDNDNVSGYEWLITNSDLLMKIQKKESVDQKFIDIAVQKNKEIDNCEWRIIKTNKDIEDLLATSWGFHDGSIREIKYFRKDYNDTTVQITFEGCWGCTITLELLGKIKIHCNTDPDYFDEIMCSSLFFEDDKIVWVDDDLNSCSDLRDENNYFMATTMRWKQNIE